MNKTISINLSGMLFNLEENAYEKLSAYLSKLRTSFQNIEGKEEILADIETRIAELFTEKLKDKQVILEKEVDEVIERLGQPEEYDVETDEEPGASQKESRDRRQQSYTTTENKRLFRDPDHSILGGVCSGAGHYLGVDAVWLRLAFVAALFFFGTGPLLYIILWIVIPKAESTADKLQMRGERVNIENIERRFREETERIRRKAGDIGEKARKDFNSSNAGARIGGMVNELVQALLNFLKGFGNVLGRVLGLFLLLLAGVTLIALLASVFTSGTFAIEGDGDDINIYRLGDFLSVFFHTGLQLDLFVIGTTLLIFTPVIGIFLLGWRLAIYPRTGLHWAASANGALFLIGLVLCIITGAMLISDFSTRGKRIDAIDIGAINSDTISLAIQPNSELNIKQFATIDSWKFYLDDEEHFMTGEVRLNVIKSAGETIAMSVNRSARGADKKEAISTAGEIRYYAKQQNNTIYINPYFSLSPENKWRRQRVEFNLEIPEGKFIKFENGLSDIIDDVPNTQHLDGEEMSGQTFIMGENGLSCVSCPVETD
ncbi:MAG: PspC domain-containing protein [Bacteroidetes bacterium]|nr:PspC domain-containing protein [Bacteroidota bacterium]